MPNPFRIETKDVKSLLTFFLIVVVAIGLVRHFLIGPRASKSSLLLTTVPADQQPKQHTPISIVETPRSTAQASLDNHADAEGGATDRKSVV